MQSGDDDDVLWVSFGFESELSKNDVLLIVCGKAVDEQDRELGMYGLYFEGSEQTRSCYNAAERITVSESAVDIDLTEEGSRMLEFPGQVRFICDSVAPEFRKAQRVFEKMMRYEWAKALQYDVKTCCGML